MKAAALVALLGTIASAAALAQLREGMPATVAPAPAAAPSPPQDVVGPFASAYRSAGRPRVVLMWNRALSEEASTPSEQRTVLHDAGTVRRGGSVESTAGGAGSATIRESTRDHDRTRTITSGTIQHREAARRPALTEREALMLERAFVNEMGRGGMRFIDRALVMRTTAADQHRGGGERQLIETDALLKHGDLILEVLLVEDREAPIGYAFDVRMKDIRSGATVSSVYTRGIGAPRRAQPGHWQAGSQGYEFKQPAAAPPPGLVEVGVFLARDVMNELQAAWRR